MVAESVPQLATQVFVLNYGADLVFFSVNKLSAVPITWLQKVSITTSVISTIRSLIDFIAVNRREYLISHRYPALASLLPYFLFLSTGVSSALLQFCFDFGYDLMSSFDSMEYSEKTPGEDCIFKVTIAFWIFNVINFIASMCIVWFSVHQNRQWRMIRTSIYACCALGAMLTLCVAIYLYHSDISDRSLSAYKNGYFYCYCVCLTTNILLGFLLLPFSNMGPRLFAPLIWVMVEAAQCGVGCFCPAKWRWEIHEKLERVLRVENRHEPGKSEGEADERNMEVETEVSEGSLRSENVDMAGERERAVEIEVSEVYKFTSGNRDVAEERKKAVEAEDSEGSVNVCVAKEREIAIFTKASEGSLTSEKWDVVEERHGAVAVEGSEGSANECVAKEREM